MSPSSTAPAMWGHRGGMLTEMRLLPGRRWIAPAALGYSLTILPESKPFKVLRVSTISLACFTREASSNFSFALDDHDAIRRGSHGPAVPPRACAHPIAASARADRYSLSTRLVARATATDPTRATPERHRYCVYGPRPEAERTDRTAILYGRAVNPVPALIGRLHRIYWLYVAQLKESSRPIDST